MLKPITAAEAAAGGVPQYVLDALAEAGVDLRMKLHPPVHTVEEARAHWADIPGAHAKNLFLKDAGGRLWLATVLSERRIDLKKLPQRIGSKRISFGSADLLRAVLGVEPGSVSPLAAMNDTGLTTTVVIDAALMSADIVNVHPMVNVATLGMRPATLVDFLRRHGHEPQIVDLDE